jgi:hypothetical protein
MALIILSAFWPLYLAASFALRLGYVVATRRYFYRCRKSPGRSFGQFPVCLFYITKPSEKGSFCICFLDYMILTVLRLFSNRTVIAQLLVFQAEE